MQKPKHQMPPEEDTFYQNPLANGNFLSQLK